MSVCVEVRVRGTGGKGWNNRRRTSQLIDWLIDQLIYSRHLHVHVNTHIIMWRYKLEINLYFSMQTDCQSINRSINQSIDQPINQPINQSINQPTNQSINQPINQSINQSINQQTIQLTGGWGVQLKHCNMVLWQSHDSCHFLQGERNSKQSQAWPEQNMSRGALPQGSLQPGLQALLIEKIEI